MPDTARLPDKQQLKALAVRSDRRGLVQLLGHAAALTISTVLIAMAEGSPWLLPCLILHGLLLVFLFAPLHECIHRTAFRSRWLNDGVAWMCGFLLLLPPVYFRAYHLTHHRHTQDPVRDPELAGGTVTGWRSYLWRLTGLPYWRDAVTKLLRHAVGRTPESFLTETERLRVVREARLFLALYALVAASAFAGTGGLLLLYWVLPALLGQPALRFYLMAEHGACPLVPDMLVNSRTTRSLAVVRRLAWNMPYHAEHHAFPGIPFHALPMAHQIIRHLNGTRSPGYLAAHRDIVAELS